MIAHIGVLPTEEFLLPVIVLGLVGWLYLRGLFRLAGLSDRRLRAGAFGLGSVTLLAAFTPQAERFADALFSVHMAQHLLLAVVVPVLLTYARSLHCITMGLSRSLRHRTRPIRRWGGARLSRLPALPVAALVFAAVLWAWHLPFLYDAAVESGTIHVLEHASFIGAGSLLWAAVLDPSRGFLPRSMLLFGTAFHSGLLGALLVLAPDTLYRSHLEQTIAPISPLLDQQLAGLLMWIPMGAVFLVTLAVLVVRGLDGPESGLVSDA